MSILNINSHYCWKFIKIGNFEARLQNCEKRLLDSSCLSDRHSAWNNSAPTGRIFMKFGIYFSKICRENSSFIKI